MLTAEQAAEVLRVARVVAVAHAGLQPIKDLMARCLALDIPAMAVRPKLPGGS